MDVVILVLQLLVVVGAIYMGTRTSGIGLGVWGLVGTAILIFGFGEAPERRRLTPFSSSLRSPPLACDDVTSNGAA